MLHTARTTLEGSKQNTIERWGATATIVFRLAQYTRIANPFPNPSPNPKIDTIFAVVTMVKYTPRYNTVMVARTGEGKILILISHHQHASTRPHARLAQYRPSLAR